MPNGQDDQKKVKDLDLGKSKGLANQKVQDLSVKDLRDLEQKFQGRNPNNKKVDALSVEDLGNLERVFQDYKQAALERAIREGPPGVPTEMDPEDWTVSCCSCTPCCCCAAAEIDPVASSATEARSS